MLCMFLWFFDFVLLDDMLSSIVVTRCLYKIFSFPKIRMMVCGNACKMFFVYFYDGAVVRSTS